MLTTYPLPSYGMMVVVYGCMHVHYYTQATNGVYTILRVGYMSGCTSAYAVFCLVLSSYYSLFYWLVVLMAHRSVVMDRLPMPPTGP
jgi:hypothetical protein